MNKGAERVKWSEKYKCSVSLSGACFIGMKARSRACGALNTISLDLILRALGRL